MFDNDLDGITRNALKKFGIRRCNTVVKKLTQRGFPAAEEPTVIFLTVGTATDTIRWQEAVDCVNEIIKDAAAQAGETMGVELQSPSQRYYDISSAISPGTSVHKVFLEIEPVVEAEVKKGCSGLWTSIAYHNRYNKFAGDVGIGEITPIEFVEQPTVIVFVVPGSLAHWGEVEAQIRHAIEAVPFEEDIESALEILPGFNTPSVNGSLRKVVMMDRWCLMSRRNGLGWYSGVILNMLATFPPLLILLPISRQEREGLSL